MIDHAETPPFDPEPDPVQPHDLTDEALELAEMQAAAWSEQLRQEELRYRYCDDPFCPCTPSKLRFLKLVGVLDYWAGLTRYGERIEYMWNTDPAAQP